MYLDLYNLVNFESNMSSQAHHARLTTHPMLISLKLIKSRRLQGQFYAANGVASDWSHLDSGAACNLSHLARHVICDLPQKIKIQGKKGMSQHYNTSRLSMCLWVGK